MGARKRIRAEKIKEARKNQYIARLGDCPLSPRKVRLMADLIRGKEVNSTLNILKHSPQSAAGYLYKLVLSAIANWQNKNEGVRVDESHLYIKEITVDSARMLKRIRPAAQGRAHRIRKRSCHITIKLNSKEEVAAEEAAAE